MELSRSLDKDKKFNCSENSKYSCLSILRKYYFSKDSSKNFIKYFKQNPFFKDFIPNVTNTISKKFVSIEPKIFAYPEAENIDLFSYKKEEPQIMAKRFKEEFTVDFFLKLKRDFENYTELKALFPETDEVAKYINTDNLYNMFPIFRNAAEKDMETLLIHLSRLRLQSKFYYSLNAEKGKLFTFISMLASGMQKGENIADIISEIAEENAIKKDTSNLLEAVKYFNLVSSCFRDTAHETMYINSSQFKNIIESETRMKIIFGLLYQKNLQLNIYFKRNEKVTFDLKKELEELAVQFKLNRSTWIGYLKQVYFKASKVEREFDSLSYEIKNNNETGKFKFRSYSSSITDFFETLVQLNLANETIIVPEEIKSSIPVIQEVNDAYCGFNTYKYGRAVFKTIQILDSTLFYDKKNKESRDKIDRYAIFFANISEAQTPEEVKMAIDAEITPVKASSLKDYAHFSVSINAYLGICSGMEYMNINNKNITTIGLSAPIGIGIYISTPKCRSIVGHAGIYFSIIDLGVPASFRLNGFNTYRLPEMNLQNILAPGASLIAGRLFNSPITLGAGVQYGPQLRLVTINGLPVNSAAWRWNISLSYDLPLVYLLKK